jgi:hypothetical protein
MFQHLVGFCNSHFSEAKSTPIYNRYSYGRRLPGLGFKASLES